VQRHRNRSDHRRSDLGAGQRQPDDLDGFGEFGRRRQERIRRTFIDGLEEHQRVASRRRSAGPGIGDGHAADRERLVLVLGFLRAGGNSDQHRPRGHGRHAKCPHSFLPGIAVARRFPATTRRQT